MKADLSTDLPGGFQSAASRAAERCGVTIQSLSTAAEVARGVDLFSQVWQADSGAPPFPGNLIRAIEHSGGYAAGAYDERGELVAVSVGFLAGAKGDIRLHSHATGVADSLRSRGLGLAIKLHQRAWCLARGIDTITWTFDPLVRRNAVFNLLKLRASATAFLPSFYGELTDGINRDDESDRLHVTWDLINPWEPLECGDGVAAVLRCGADERPVAEQRDGDMLLVCLPRDIEVLRRHDVAVGHAWRRAVRSALGDRMSDGWRIVGVDARLGYLVARPKDGGESVEGQVRETEREERGAGLDVGGRADQGSQAEPGDTTVEVHTVVRESRWPSAIERREPALKTCLFTYRGGQSMTQSRAVSLHPCAT